MNNRFNIGRTDSTGWTKPIAPFAFGGLGPRFDFSDVLMFFVEASALD